MRIRSSLGGAIVWSTALSGCVSAGASGGRPAVSARPTSARGSGGGTVVDLAAPSCAGPVSDAPPGTRRVEDPALLALAIGGPEQGKLCSGEVFEADRPVIVYRVWQGDRPASERGRWWTLERPTGTRADYRADNIICPEWSALDQLSRCELRAGARFVMGPGQSTRCADGRLLAGAAHNQVFIDNDARVGRLHVDRCEPLAPLP